MNIFNRLRRKTVYILPSANASMVSQYANGFRDGRTRGYAAGLEAAREAVADALERGLANSTDKALYYFEADDDDPTIGHDVTFHKQDLLAAIDALRGES